MHQFPGQLPASITVRLAHHASRIPERVAYTFLQEGEQPSAELTFAQLAARVSGFSARIATMHQPGERLILLYPQGLDFLVAFLGCLQAGMVAVPVSLPNRHRGVSLLCAIALDSGATAILSESSLLDRMETSLAGDSFLSALPRLATETWLEPAPSSWVAPLIESDSPALIQYTSGSTGSPRGVLVSHGNLIHNQQQFQESCGYTTVSVAVSWLPLFHDLGLGVALMTVSSGMRGILMSPSAFVQKPIRWLRAISDYRATFSCAPDFGYDLSARRISPSECEGLDLSRLAVAFNGAEPVRAATFERFVTAFAPYGFRGENYKPGYGLAEATVVVTADAPGRAPTVRRFSTELLEQGRGSAPRSIDDPSRALIGCGQPRSGAGVCIVNPVTRQECDAGSIGEIWVSGPSVAHGYWGLAEMTEATFRAFTSDGRGPFLRTGDLGFLDDESLFIAGRIKDLIIVRGRNHYPQDIEATVSTCHPALEPQRCAAFSVEGDDGEQLVVVQEVRRSGLRSLDTPEVFRAINSAVSREHGLQTHSIVLIRPASLPRTTSGKVQRRACAKGLLEHSLNEVASWGSAGSPAPENDSLVEPGGCLSANAAHLVDWIREQFSTGKEERDLDVGAREPRPELAAALRQRGALSLCHRALQGGLALNLAEAASVLEQVGEIDINLARFMAVANAKQPATQASSSLPPPALIDARLALAAASVGCLKRCEQLARRHSPYFGRALRKKLTPDPDVLAQLGALAARGVALQALVVRAAQVFDGASASVREDLLVICQIASERLLDDSLQDLCQLAAGSPDASEQKRISRLEDAAAEVWQADAADEAARWLGARVLLDSDVLNRVASSFSPGAQLMPLVARATNSARTQIERVETAGNDPSAAGPAQQVGALTSSLALMTAAEGARQDAPSPDLDRAAMWIRSQVEYALVMLRSGEAPSLDAEGPSAVLLPPPAAEPSASAVRAWLVAWVSRRMRIPEAEVAPSRSFADYGLDSVAAVELAKALSDKLGRPFDDTLLWNFSTIDSLIEFVTSV